VSRASLREAVSILGTLGQLSIEQGGTSCQHNEGAGPPADRHGGLRPAIRLKFTNSR
jgi:hypothetical protein